MPEGTVFSSAEEKDRVHLTRTDDERQTRVRLILEAAKLWRQQCRVIVGILGCFPLDTRTELIQVFRKKDSVFRLGSEFVR